MQNKQQPPKIFNHERLKQNRLRAKPAFNDYNFLFQEVESRLNERVLEVTRELENQLHLGFPHLNNSEQFSNDTFIAEPQSLNLITSNMQLHWANDLPGVLIQLRQALKPDGLLLTSMLGGDTLFELKNSLLEAELAITNKASMRTSPMADVRQLGGLLMRAGFALPVVDVDRITVSYQDTLSLMRDLRFMGEGNALEEQTSPLRKDVLVKTQEIYEQKFPHPDGNGICATFDVVFLTGWAPHADQPQPLKPGSAKVNLAEVLKPKNNNL